MPWRTIDFRARERKIEESTISFGARKLRKFSTRKIQAQGTED